MWTSTFGEIGKHRDLIESHEHILFEMGRFLIARSQLFLSLTKRHVDGTFGLFFYVWLILCSSNLFCAKKYWAVDSKARRN
jgi:hypothetical protein